MMLGTSKLERFDDLLIYTLYYNERMNVVWFGGLEVSFSI
jgi:hypothetical protein